MAESARLASARQAYQAYETGDRSLIESLLTDDFEFFAPAGPGHRPRHLLRALLAQRREHRVV